MDTWTHMDGDLWMISLSQASWQNLADIKHLFH